MNYDMLLLQMDESGVTPRNNEEELQNENT